MKFSKIIFPITAFIFCLSCRNNSVANDKPASVKSEDTIASYYNKQGTVNLIDDKGNRQGLWIITGAMKKNPDYADTARVEEGHYINNEKNGVWYEFNPNGSVKIQLNYQDNKTDTNIVPSPGINTIDADGKRQGYWVIFGRMQKDIRYAPDSKVEEGSYKDNLKTGSWTEYTPNGKVKNHAYYSQGKIVSPVINCIDSSGKMQGYWEFTGAMKKNSRYGDTARVEGGTYVDNVKVGLWTEYNPDGSVKTQLIYKNGKVMK